MIFMGSKNRISKYIVPILQEYIDKNNIVICSEYNMSDDFICIWQKETKVNFDSNRTSNNDKNKRIEKMFIHKDLYDRLNNK